MPLIALSDAVLPAVGTLHGCANFNLTVRPYLPQLQTLPTQVVEHLSSFEDLKGLYLSTNPLISAVAFCLFMAPVCLIVSEVNRNYSEVDRLWPILPSLYNAHYALWAHMHGLPAQRLDNLLACSMAWTVRLVYNYWRKGGYNIGHEDYRWEILRARMSRTAFFFFNVFFISLYQNFLLLIITTPTYILLLAARAAPQSAMTISDVVFARLLMGVVLFEWFADQQQWNFQQAKKAYLKDAKLPSGFSQAALDRGFVTSGLWAYSRHPNFLAEQAVWVVMYAWSCWATGTYLNWSLVGAGSYVLLFRGSSDFSEEISAGKYPDYKEYQKRVGRFLPKLMGPGVAEWNKNDNGKKVQ